MHLRSLYPIRMRYLTGGSVDLAGSDSTESQYFFLAE
jgi:hypothetical protein